MSITINLEIGHDASLRTKTTPEGFTHDWEVYVKGCNGAEIHYYVEKVVFHLHETFPKPKRVVKEPPYALRTSGYAGFNLPIEIYLRNNQEPKKIRFNYDLQLQPRGPPIHNVQKEKYVFHSPSEDFRSKLLKGGGIVGSQGSAQDIGDSKAIDDKNQMTSKPKLSGAEVPKKHKNKPDEPRNTDFLNLFGTPITKTSKAPEPPKPKEVPKNFPKLDKQVDKDKTKTKNPYKDKEKEKPKDKEKSSDSSEKKKEEKKKSKEDKSKDRDRVKEKSSKKDKEREKSPSARPRSPSPKRSPKRPPSPPPQKHSSSKEKETSKEERKDKDRKDEKKNKKDKREHKESKHKDRDKDKEHKEHKSRDSKSSKDSSSASLKEEANPTPNNVAAPQIQQKSEKKEKSKESVKESKDEEKSEKSRSDKSEDKQKHKHKKKDRKEKREDKYSSKTEKKSEKPPTVAQPVKEEPKEPPPVSSSRDTDKSNLFGSPKSEPPTTPNQIEPKDKSTNNLTFKEEEISNDSLKVSSRESSPQRAPVKSPSQPPPEPVKKIEPEKKKEESSKKKDKKEKKKDKKSDRDHEKRRKRKSPQSHQEEPPEKVLKEEENNNSDDERKVSSTEDAKPLPNNEAEDYMGMLRDLQHKIMGLKDNSDLQKVVQLIAETGRYEVSAHTFDFDLCLLDRSTVRQLQDFFASIS